MRVEFGVFKKLFSKEVLEIVEKELIEMYEYETVEYLTKEEQDGCYLRVEEMTLERAMARVITKESFYALCDDIHVYYGVEIREEIILKK